MFKVKNKDSGMTSFWDKMNLFVTIKVKSH